MSSMSPASLKNVIKTNQDSLVKALQGLTIIESWTSKGTLQSTIFYHIPKNEEEFFGHTSKNKYTTTHLTLAPEALGPSLVYVKRPSLQWYEEMVGTNHLPSAVIGEKMIMEQISQNPHKNIILYHCCCVKRGYITCLVFERLDQTLNEYILTSDFQRLDIVKYWEPLGSAVDYLHSLGQAHNDINPGTIMVKGREPMLIDFDYCQPFGKRRRSLGTERWCEDLFNT